MRVVASGDGQAGTAQLGLQLGRAVDAHVSADTLRSVVFVAEHPVDLFGKPRRHGRRKRAARLQHPDEFADRGGVGLDVFEHLAGDDAIEAAVGERQQRGVALQTTDETLLSDLARLAIAANVARVASTAPSA